MQNKRECAAKSAGDHLSSFRRLGGSDTDCRRSDADDALIMTHWSRRTDDEDNDVDNADNDDDDDDVNDSDVNNYVVILTIMTTLTTVKSIFILTNQ